MARPFDQASDRYFIPSTSSGSSSESSGPSLSSPPLGLSHLPRDIDNLHLTRPDSQPLGHNEPVIKLGRMADRLDDDTMMLDDWEEEGKRGERDHDASLDTVPLPFQLESSSTQQPSTDVIDVPKLARQDQPPPAYENVDERPSTLTSRASRPLPRPPIDRLSSTSSIHSVGLVTDTGPHDSAPQSPNCIDPMLSAGQPFPSAAGTSQSPSVSVGLLPPLDSASQDRLAANISLFHTFPPRMASEPSQQVVSPSSFDHDSSWTPNPSFPGAQQEASVSSRPISSSSIQTLSPPPPYSPSEASPSRTGHPLSEYAPDLRSTHRPRPALPAPSNRGLPPPAPPTILDPPPARPNSFRRSYAPHEPFLCDAPPPPDSWLAVETSPIEYRLVARLPGFRRDAITLAARRRRVLHVAADSWEPGGGHFERRISFGYDADLSHVRAEFDGEILRVIVPRRTPPVTWYGAACE